MENYRMTYGTHSRQKNWRAKRNTRFFRDDRKYGLIAKVFYRYRKIVQEVAEAKAELGYYQSGHKEGSGSSNHAFVSDPTAQIAMKHLRKVHSVVLDFKPDGDDVLENPEEWIDIVDNTLQYFKDDKIVRGVLVERFINNRGWMKVCADLDITKDVLYGASNAGLQYARECAIQLGLIKVF